jgi:methyl-accepting chemotaxis protein
MSLEIALKTSRSALAFKLLLPIGACAALVLGIVLAVIAYYRGDAIEQAGLSTGKAVANQVVALRAFYTTEIASRAKKSGMQMGFDYTQRDGVLPLPATLVKALGEDIAKKYPGSEVKLKSAHPFPNRTAEESRLDAFQTDALAALTKDPAKPVWGLQEINGRLSMRYAVADVMKEGCVACHNSHPQSPKRDWKVGDVRGLVEVVVPVDEVASQANSQALIVCALVVSGFGLIGLVMAVLLKRLVTAPIANASQQMAHVAQGELNAQGGAAGGSQEMDVLFESLDTLVRTVRHTVSDVRDAAGSILTASSEVASGNADLSHRTEVAAANLQKTSSSVEELAGTVRHSADAAATANGLAHSAADVASHGGQVVEQVVSTMDAINASSKQISDIIGVIDGIAFQTNILALNAAVEAARAGEQGRGFAVVAGEVRTLAQRSASAAKEIKALINSSVDKVETGARLVKDAGTTMQDIVSSVERVRDIIGEISGATSQQSAGIGQVNEAMSQLDQMTQQNAALVEESAAAADSLNQQASKLVDAVSVYKL